MILDRAPSQNGWVFIFENNRLWKTKEEEADNDATEDWFKSSDRFYPHRNYGRCGYFGYPRGVNRAEYRWPAG
jgi:hypothetical protein